VNYNDLRFKASRAYNNALVSNPYIGESICDEIPPNPKKIDTIGFSTESVTIFHAF